MLYIRQSTRLANVNGPTDEDAPKMKIQRIQLQLKELKINFF